MDKKLFEKFLRNLLVVTKDSILNEATPRIKMKHRTASIENFFEKAEGWEELVDQDED